MKYQYLVIFYDFVDYMIWLCLETSWNILKTMIINEIEIEMCVCLLCQWFMIINEFRFYRFLRNNRNVLRAFFTRTTRNN